jgi:hypothetical protein
VNSKTNFFVYTLVCLLILLFSYVNEFISIIFAIFFGFLLIWRSKIDVLIGLIVLYVIKQNFYHIIDYKTMGSVVEGDFIRENFVIFGFPLNLPTLACFFVPARVIFEQVTNKNTFLKHNFLYRLWLFALIPGFISFILSFITRDPNWTRGFRFLLLSSSFFYGLILTKDLTNISFNLFIKYLLLVITISLFLLNINIFWSHLVFLFIGLSSSFSIFFLFKKNIIDKTFGILTLLFTLLIVINSTITIMLICLLSFSLIILSWTSKNKITTIKNNNIIRIKYFLLFISITFPFIVIFIGNIIGLEIGYIDVSSNSGFRTRLLEKVLLDRYPFWVSAFNQIINGPYFFVTSGRPLLVNGLDSQFEWIVGAHNVVLEVFRNTGILVGCIILYIYLYTLNQLFNILVNNNNNLIKTVTTALIGVAISGILTGDFPADMTVGFFLWSICGLVVGINEKKLYKF